MFFLHFQVVSCMAFHVSVLSAAWRCMFLHFQVVTCMSLYVSMSYMLFYISVLSAAWISVLLFSGCELYGFLCFFLGLSKIVSLSALAGLRCLKICYMETGMKT